MIAPASRRGFLRALSALPLLGGGAALALPAPEPSRFGKGCIMLDRLVFFDANLVPAVGEPALVVLHDGRMAVMSVVEACGTATRGHVYVEGSTAEHPGALRCLAQVALIGAIVGERAR